MHRREKDGRVTLESLTEAWARVVLRAGKDHPEHQMAQPLKLVIIDTEFNGLMPLSRVIEVGMLEVDVCRTTWEVLQVRGTSMLNDPGEPIEPAVSRLTGINDADVRGQRADWRLVAETVESAHVVLAHNVQADKPRIDNELRNEFALDTSHTGRWGCTQLMIPWRDEHGAASAALQPLCWQLAGFYLDGGGHRAVDDCKALLLLLLATGELQRVCERSMSPSWRVAPSTPYDPSGMTQARFKARRYRWDPDARAWGRLVWTELEAVEEERWFNDWAGTGRKWGFWAQQVQPEDRWP